MATASELRQLANERISEAEVLLTNERFEGVFYLAGYAIEFALKVVICDRLGTEMFDQQNVGEKDVSPKVVSAFMTHHLGDLLVLSGLREQLKSDARKNITLMEAWEDMCKWSEQRRYDRGCQADKALKFLNNSKLVLTWIKNQGQKD